MDSTMNKWYKGNGNKEKRQSNYQVKIRYKVNNDCLEDQKNIDQLYKNL